MGMMVGVGIGVGMGVAGGVVGARTIATVTNLSASIITVTNESDCWLSMPPHLMAAPGSLGFATRFTWVPERYFPSDSGG